MSSIVAYIVSQELAQASSLLPSNKQRSTLVHSLVSSMGLFSPNYSSTNRLQPTKPVRATRADLTVYHDSEYVDFCLGNSKQTDEDLHEEFGLQDDCPIFAGLSDYVQLVAGGSLLAANILRQGKADVSICWDGGRHHAQKSHASGFCYIADCILDILALKKPAPSGTLPRKPRVMYLDLDLHFSDAVSQAFYSPSQTSKRQVLTLSIHHASPGFFPVSHLSGIDRDLKDPFTLSLPLNAGASNNTYARIWLNIVEKVQEAFSPDYLIVQCGVDGLAGDPNAIGNWSIGSIAEDGSMGWCIQKIMAWKKPRKLFLGGGGYNSPNAARAWTYLTSVILDNPLPLDTEIPDHPGFPLYGPSFTLNVPAGNRPDLNSAEYLETLEEHFQNVVRLVQERVQQ